SPPTVAITSPTSSGSYTTTSSPLSIGGTASDNVGVTQVTWANNRGGSGTATGTTTWSASGIALLSGSNVITVTAADAAGNTGTASLTVTYNPSDTSPPTVAITSPTSSGSYTTSSSPLSIGGTASDNVGVTQVTWANNRGGSGTATGTTSWSVSGIALQSGSNVITVTARDAAGNSGTASLTVTYNASDTTPPVISAVSARVTSTTAIISWETNEAATSQVEYGTAATYGSTTVADPNLVSSHSQTLTGLTPKTDYHFRVKSGDSAGNVAVSDDLSFKTSASDGAVKLILYYPSMSSSRRRKNKATLADDEYTSIALTNLDTTPATITFTAFDADGVQLSGTGITNPVSKTLDPGAQVPVIDYQLFGDAIMAVGPLGWIQVDSTTSKLSGFFMTFDSQLTYLDGADISSSLVSSFVLSEVTDKDFTEILFANPNSATASVRLDLIRGDGSLQASSQQTIKAGGVLSADLFTDVFAGVTADAGAYIRVTSSKGLIAYETTGKDSKDMAILAGQDINAGASRVYSPQYAVGGPWRTTISVVNLDGVSGTLTLKLISDNGLQIGASKFVNIAGGGKVNISDQSFFDDSVSNNPGQVVQGYVEITGLGLHLAGSVVFGDALQGTFTSALPLVAALQKSVIFSHVASDSTYFTGLAIVNPNGSSAVATVDLYDSDGKLLASDTRTIPAMWRTSRLLTQYFPSLAGQSRTSGYFKVTVDNGAACFALFGKQDLSVLSAIPGQPIP
ncbi:MAG TPA: fibronectin type III domain-containing protein, partial [Acidobacteriota bacterium]|nr:fibronectin type III domain-containing protein [Acidobacteriota bacterium]